MFRRWKRDCRSTTRIPNGKTGTTARPRLRPALEALEERTLLAAGALDPSFGTGGKVLGWAQGYPVEGTLAQVVVQPDGKPVVAGTAGRQPALARYNLDGTLDATFGRGGFVLDERAVRSSYFTDLALLPDGRIMVVGAAMITPGGLLYDALIARFNPDGSPDRSFGTEGRVILDYANQDAVHAVALQPDGRIVAAGWDLVLRLNDDGSLDQTFGSRGVVRTDLGGTATEVIVQPDGKLVAAGWTGSNFMAARFNADGSFDVSFGTGGKFVYRPGAGISGQAYGAALQADGKIVLGGVLSFPGETSSTFNLLRLTAQGSPDATFGNGGLVRTSMVDGRYSAIIDVLVQPDGKIVAAGVAADLFAAARYHPDGRLDTSFDEDGKVLTSFRPDLGLHTRAYGAALLRDGRLILAGSSDRPAQGPAPRYTLARYHADGSLDAAFGESGKVVTQPIGIADARAQSVAIQTDGKVLVTSFRPQLGFSSILDYPRHFATARYLANGRLDESFGNGGWVVTELGSSVEVARDILVAADGKILVVGNDLGTLIVVRYLADGRLDTSFGTGGKATFRQLPQAWAAAVTIQPDGKIVVAGAAGVFAKDFVLVRFTSQGTLDTSFGTQGWVTTDFLGKDDRATGIVLQPDGKLVVLGLTGQNEGGFFPTYVANYAFARYDASGRLDATFGVGGKLTLFGGVGDFPFRPVLQPDGKLVLAGYLPRGGGSHDLALYRLTTRGSLDPTFGVGGAAFFDLGGSEFLTAVALQPDGKLVAVGRARTLETTNVDFVVARFNPNGTLDTHFGTRGRTTIDLAGQEDEALGVAIQADGRIVVAGGAGPAQLGIVRLLGDDRVADDNLRFVQQVYLDLLFRTPEPVGQAGFLAYLNQGGSRALVAQAIQASPEYRTLVIRELYGQYFGRAPDPAGIALFLGAFNAGVTIAQVRATILGSSEYYQNRGGSTNDGFLTTLYQDVLHRPLDEAARQLFGQALAAGVSPIVVAGIVVRSPESLQLGLQGWYRHFLRRSVDTAGLQLFLGALQAGVREELVISVLVGSEEYFRRV